MIRAKLISADFEESTIELEIEHDFTVRHGEYIILTKEEFEELSNKANTTTETNPNYKITKVIDESNIKKG